MGICGSSAPSNQGTLHHPMPPRQQNTSPQSRLSSEERQLLEQICPSHPDHGLLEQELLPLLSVKNPNNLNNRYTYLYKVDEKQTVGKGIKLTNGYASRVPMPVLQKKRQEFWGRRG